MTLWLIGLIAAILYGVSIGSFLNVVIYRLPLDQSVAEPLWSYCPNCRHRLGGADLIPLLSFLALGRRCRYCRQPISWRYFGVELLTGVLFALVFVHDGLAWDAVFHCLLMAVLVPIFFIDLAVFLIPDELSVIGFVVGVAYNVYNIWQGAPGQWMQLGGTSARLLGSIGAAVVCALIFHVISFAGLLYYNGSQGVRASGSFWLGVLDDYAYLGVKFLGFGLWLPPARRYIASREVPVPVPVPASVPAGGEHGSAPAEAAESDAGAPLAAEGSVGARVGVAAPARATHAEIAAEIEEDEQQTGMGQGDAKLAALIGANLLLPLSLLSFFLAVLAGTVIGVGIMAARRSGGRTAIPFGPYLVAGALLAYFFGQQMLAAYARYAFGAR